MRISALCVAVVAALLMAAPAGADAPPVRGAATHPLWGSSTTADFDLELDKLVEAGANTVRIDLGWSTLEADGKGELSDWYVAKADTFFAHARARGLKVVVTFWTTPCWASAAPDDVKDGCEGAWWDRGVDRYPPADPADFADAAAWVASRWAGDLAAIEIWNEANYQPFFRSATPAADYAAMLKASYTAVKAASPSTTVIGPGMVMSDPPVPPGALRPRDQGLRGRDLEPPVQPREHPVRRGGGDRRSALFVRRRRARAARGDGGERRRRPEALVHRVRLVELCARGDEQPGASRPSSRRRTSATRSGSSATAGTTWGRRSSTTSATRARTRAAARARWGCSTATSPPKPSFAAFAAAWTTWPRTRSGRRRRLHLRRLRLRPRRSVTSSGPPPSRPLAPSDTVAPAVAALKASAVLLRRPRAGGRVSYRLSEQAEVRLALARVVRARCVLRSRRNCTRLARMRGAVLQGGASRRERAEARHALGRAGAEARPLRASRHRARRRGQRLAREERALPRSPLTRVSG